MLWAAEQRKVTAVVPDSIHKTELQQHATYTGLQVISTHYQCVKYIRQHHLQRELHRPAAHMHSGLMIPPDVIAAAVGGMYAKPPVTKHANDLEQ
jgi:hypothetical protein